MSAASTASMSSSAMSTAMPSLWILGFLSPYYIVLIGDSFVAFLLDMTMVSAVDTHELLILLSWQEDVFCHIGLDGILISFNTKRLD
jgi:hypothetical protein